MRTYAQFCGLARAADAIGERWSLLIVRDLAAGPERFGELRDTLGAPSNILTARLKQLEAEGIVERTLAPGDARAVLYRLTDRGADLVPILDALGRWGARRMSEPRAGERVTERSLAGALRCGFTGAATRRTRWHVLAGPTSCWAETSPGNPLRHGAGTPAGDEPVVTISGEGLRALLGGRLSPAKALSDELVDVTPGGREGVRHLTEFTRCFHVPLDEEPTES